MSQQTISIPWGNDPLRLELPDSWHIAGTLEPASLLPTGDVQSEVVRSLNEPVGCQRLSELARGKKHVVLVIDDLSRPTPVGKVLPEVLIELEKAGISKNHLTLIPALGLHRAMEANEIAERVGADLFSGMKWENPDCDDLAKLVLLGTTQRGTPAWVNKTVAEADLVISVGCIEPHIIASFGGGYKNIFPGTAGRAMIAHNHTLNCTPANFNNVGSPIEKNPMRLDLEEAGRMLRADVFIINTILNYRQEIVKVVAGDPVKAHRSGVEVSAKLYAAPISSPADVVITASHPMDSDLRQGVKALANTVRAVKPGGVIITYVRAVEGTGVFGLANRKLPLGKSALRLLAPVLLPLVPKLKLKGLGEEDRFFLYFALQAMHRATLLMYAPTIPAQVQENLPFMDFIESPQGAIAVAVKKFPHQAEVLIFPHGGITYPELA